MVIMDNSYESSEDNISLNEFKPTGQRRVLILAKADEVPENRHNIEIILTALNLPDVANEFQLVCDLKLTNIILGNIV